MLMGLGSRDNVAESAGGVAGADERIFVAALVGLMAGEAARGRDRSVNVGGGEVGAVAGGGHAGGVGGQGGGGFGGGGELDDGSGSGGGGGLIAIASGEEEEDKANG